MSDELPWVVAWVVPKMEFEIPCWLMVKHKHRGWELPGGSLEGDEPAEIAALRELFEEAGILGTATDVDDSLFDEGTVVKIVVDDEPQPYGWESKDENIEEAGWCVEIPGGLHWGDGEIQRLIDHDWSKSRSLSS